MIPPKNHRLSRPWCFPGSTLTLVVVTPWASFDTTRSHILVGIDPRQKTLVLGELRRIEDQHIVVRDLLEALDQRFGQDPRTEHGFLVVVHDDQGPLVGTRQIGAGIAKVRRHRLLGVEVGRLGNPLGLAVGVVLGEDRHQAAAQVQHHEEGAAGDVDRDQRRQTGLLIRCGALHQQARSRP